MLYQWDSGATLHASSDEVFKALPFFCYLSIGKSFSEPFHFYHHTYRFCILVTSLQIFLSTSSLPQILRMAFFAALKDQRPRRAFIQKKENKRATGAGYSRNYFSYFRGSIPCFNTHQIHPSPPLLLLCVFDCVLSRLVVVLSYLVLYFHLIPRYFAPRDPLCLTCLSLMMWPPPLPISLHPDFVIIEAGNYKVRPNKRLTSKVRSVEKCQSLPNGKAGRIFLLIHLPFSSLPSPCFAFPYIFDIRDRSHSASLFSLFSPYQSSGGQSHDAPLPKSRTHRSLSNLSQSCLLCLCHVSCFSKFSLSVVFGLSLCLYAIDVCSL